MKNIKINKIQIVSALTWAAALIGCAYAVKGTENAEIVFNILFVGATMNFLLLSELKGKSEKLIEKSKGILTK